MLRTGSSRCRHGEFLTGHFSAVQTATDLNLDTFSTHAHSVGNSHLDSATVSNLALYLASDALTNDVSIEVGLLYFEDIDLNVLIGNLLQFFLKFVNFCTTLTNDDTGA